MQITPHGELPHRTADAVRDSKHIARPISIGPEGPVPLDPIHVTAQVQVHLLPELAGIVLGYLDIPAPDPLAGPACIRLLIKNTFAELRRDQRKLDLFMKLTADMGPALMDLETELREGKPNVGALATAFTKLCAPFDREGAVRCTKSVGKLFGPLVELEPQLEVWLEVLAFDLRRAGVDPQVLPKPTSWPALLQRLCKVAIGATHWDDKEGFGKAFRHVSRAAGDGWFHRRAVSADGINAAIQDGMPVFRRLSLIPESHRKVSSRAFDRIAPGWKSKGCEAAMNVAIGIHPVGREPYGPFADSALRLAADLIAGPTSGNATAAQRESLSQAFAAFEHATLQWHPKCGGDLELVSREIEEASASGIPRLISELRKATTAAALAPAAKPKPPAPTTQSAASDAGASAGD